MRADGPAAGAPLRFLARADVAGPRGAPNRMGPFMQEQDRERPPVAPAASRRPGVRTGLPWRYRLAVLSRTGAAAGGGYVLAAVAAGSLGVLFAAGGMPRVQAVMAGTLLSFLVQVCAVLWAFGCASAARAWAGIAVPTVALALLGTVVSPGGAA